MQGAHHEAKKLETTGGCRAKLAQGPVGAALAERRQPHLGRGLRQVALLAHSMDGGVSPSASPSPADSQRPSRRRRPGRTSW